MASEEQNENFEGDNVDVTESFDAMGLDENILRGIYAYGFEKPSPIQQRAIKAMITGRDIIAQAQSGTGKTGTFVISILQRLDFSNPMTQALIISPTRELAKQSCDRANQLGAYCKVTTHYLIGGTNVQTDVYALKDGKQIVSGTPGRIYDMINRDALKIENLKILVLDEADTMLDRGFKDQIYEIFKKGIPSTTQIALYSATWTNDSQEIANKFMNNPTRIIMKKERLTLDGIKQYKVEIKKEEFKFDVLLDLYKAISIKQAIIYCNNKKRAEDLASALNEKKISMVYIHGDLSQVERDKTMEEFKSGKQRILIATDLLSRGIDIQQISIVINYDFPNDRACYLHRIGRSGRFGRKGVALNLVTERDIPAVKDVMDYYKTDIEELPNDIERAFNV